MFRFRLISKSKPLALQQCQLRVETYLWLVICGSTHAIKLKKLTLSALFQREAG